MKQVLIKRLKSSVQGTFGELFIDGKYFCKTGELPLDYDSDGVLNEKSKESISQGTYTVVPRDGSPKFNYLHYHILDVPNRDWVLIHIGNYCGAISKGYKSDIEGCIVLGKTVANDGKQDIVTHSRDTFNDFVAKVGEESFELTIENHLG